MILETIKESWIMSSMKRQVNEACKAMIWNEKNKEYEQCGSYYRNGEYCNICKAHAPVKEVERAFVQKKSHGTGWDKKAHKVIY